MEDVIIENEKQPKKWEFRKLNATDLWLITPILRKIGINNIRKCFNGEIVQQLVAEKVAENEANAEDTDNVDQTTNVDGLLNAATFGAVFELLQIIVEGADNCKDDLFNLLEKTSNLKRKEIEELDIMELPLMVYDFIFDFTKNSNFREFTKRVDFSKVVQSLAR